MQFVRGEVQLVYSIGESPMPLSVQNNQRTA
jgi:hypothetical protein